MASPGGLASVRSRFKAVIAKYNEDDAMRRGVVFIPVGWEATLGGFERPQAIINKHLEECDSLVLVLHDRWGTPSTAGYVSNTMEEFELSRGWLADESKPMSTIQVLFKAVEPERLTDAGPQLQAVQDFKKKIQDEDLLMYHQFDSDDEFEGILRKLLAELVWNEEQESRSKAYGSAPDGPPAPATEATSAGTKALAPQVPDEKPSIDYAERLANAHRWIEAERIFATLLTGEVDVPTMVAYATFLVRQRRRAKAGAVLNDAAAAAKAVGNRRWGGLAALAKAKFVHTVEGEEASLPLVTRAVGDLQDPDADRADALLTLADFSYHDDDPASGVEELRAAQEAVLHADVPRLVARLNALIARRAFNEERINEAIDLYKGAIATAAGVLANIEIGEMHVALGVAQERTGEVDDALQSYRDGGALFESEEASAKLADALDLQANAELELGRSEVAAALYERAAGLFETLTRYGSAVDAYLSVSKIEETLGHHGAVELAMERVLELADRLTDQKEVDEIYQILEASRDVREKRATASADNYDCSAIGDDAGTD